MVRKPPHHPSYFGYSGRPLEQDPNIRPVGNGHLFSYQRVIGPDQLSPRSSSSDESSEEEEEEEEEEGDGREEDGDVSMSDVAHPRNLVNLVSVESSEYDEVDELDEDDDDGDDEDDGLDEDDYEGEEQDIGFDAPPQVRVPLELGSAPVSTAGSEVQDETARQTEATIATVSAALICDLIIEDIDPMDSGCEGLEVLFPTEVESNRSRSRSRQKDFDKGMVRDFKNLHCSDDASDNEPDAEGELSMTTEYIFLKRQKEMRRIRRVSLSSTGKRTHSEMSDSDDSDNGGLDVNDVGSSARRMRKRLHRGSLLFQDPPAPRIDELEEPDSSEDENAADPLARELPYWTMEIIEVESS
ncbi:hypothetical protein ED733_008331 [Metarhizium rileyi]|nr:hypothetical protein ED733_008331 [Metarhizium rileyi]